jgi:hypothetical protein
MTLSPIKEERAAFKRRDSTDSLIVNSLFITDIETTQKRLFHIGAKLNEAQRTSHCAYIRDLLFEFLPLDNVRLSATVEARHNGLLIARMVEAVSARRARLCTPLPTSETYSGIFTRKERSKSGHPRFYLFTPAEELELAAECHGSGDLSFPIAHSSVHFSESQNPLFLGLMTRAKDAPTYFVKLRDDHGEHKDALTVRYLCRWEKRVLDFSRVMVVMPFANGIAKQEIRQLDFRDNIGKVFPKMELDAEKSIKNVFLGTADSGHQFSFAKLAEDEYQFAVSGGLSVFQGFAIAISTFYKTRHEV